MYIHIYSLFISVQTVCFMAPSQAMQTADIDDGIQFADIIRVQENTRGCDLSQEHLEPPAAMAQLTVINGSTTIYGPTSRILIIPICRIALGSFHLSYQKAFTDHP